ncbi:hypothetical protein OIV83_001334 [Microbotryomycetes sp. JL201]|nr:hypothetical protein OIV83_001334 [Microbotryomycetes sp. JL201]
MNTLPQLPNITEASSRMHQTLSQLEPSIVRVLGQNPGRYTLQGTNTYLIKHPATSAAILLDAGQGIEGYTTLLRPLLTPQTRLTIILSHWHEDHVNGLPDVLDLVRELGCPPPSVWKFAATEPDKDAHIESLISDDHAVARPQLGLGLLATTPGKIHKLQEGQMFGLSDDSLQGFVASGPTLEVVHAPGHTSDSVALVFHPRGPTESDAPALFTFDTVLGHGTAVFEDLGAYMSSLTKCIAKLESAGVAPPTAPSMVKLYPGHGEVVLDGVTKMKEYITHRQQRENEVVDSLRTASEPTTATALCEKIYGDTIPDALKLAATRGLILHLEKLERERKVLRYEVSDKGHEVIPGWGDGWTLLTGTEDQPKM